jgi:hypothetical protein
MALVPSIATVAANLLTISSARESSNPHSGPPKLRHQFRQPAARASTAAMLRNFQDVEQHLCGNALGSIVTDSTTQSFERQPPRIRVSSFQFDLDLPQLT